jgi:hypothetical protein
MGLKEEVIDMKKEVKEVKEEHKKSFAYELMEYSAIMADRKNKRLTIVVIVVVIFWALTFAYLAYVLNDIGVAETNVTQDNANGYNNYIGNDGEINNGKTDNN